MTTSSTHGSHAIEPAAPRLAASTHVQRAGAASASLAFAWRALLRIRHVPEQMLDVVAIPIVFTLMFTYLFGGAIAGSTGTYLQFIFPGALVMAVVLPTMYAGIGLNTDLSKGVFERFRSLPIWPPAPILGALIGEAGRYLIAATLVIALGLAMGFNPSGGAGGMLAGVALILLFALSLSWAWTALALLVRTPAAVMSVATIVVFPLTLASNTFVAPRTLPGWLRAFVHINPISHLVTAERGLMHGSATTWQIAWVLIACAALTGIFAPLTMRLYAREHHPA